MIQISEAIVLSTNKSVHRELNFKVRIKLEDYDEKMEEALYALSSSGQPVAIVIQEFGTPIQENLSKLRQQLALGIKEYATHRGISEETELEHFYAKYKISSRIKLTEAQLKDAIASYRLGLLE